MLMWHADWAQLSISLLAHFVEQVMGRPRSQHPSCSPSCRPAPSTMALILRVRSWAGPDMRCQEKTAEGCDIDEGSKFLFHFLIRPVPKRLLFNLFDHVFTPVFGPLEKSIPPFSHLHSHDSVGAHPSLTHAQ